jgi:small subunit ribosomal protein S11
MAKVQDATAPTEKGKGEGGKKPARKTFKKRGEKRVVHHGYVHIHASFNNTHITITDTEGNVIAWSSAGGIGFKGSRKGTPFAATQAAINGRQRPRRPTDLRSVEVKVKGPGSGRESAIRALQTIGIEVKSIRDVTPIPHKRLPPDEETTSVIDELTNLRIDGLGMINSQNGIRKFVNS